MRKPYPVILSIVRHALSSENVVFNHEGHGGGHEALEKVTELPTWERPLSAQGVAQARRARETFEAWRQSQKTPPRLVGYASHYVRARETAGLMDLGLKWKLDVRLSERNWGMMTFIPDETLKTHYPYAEHYRERDRLLWAPLGGDSMQLVVAYLHDFLATLARDCPENEAVIVSHGETMYAFQYILDHWLPEELATAMNGGGPVGRISNCMMLQYSRIGEDGRTYPHYVRKRFVDLLAGVAALDAPWVAVPAERTFSGKELLAQVAHIERHV